MTYADEREAGVTMTSAGSESPEQLHATFQDGLPNDFRLPTQCQARDRMHELDAMARIRVTNDALT